MGLSHAAAEGGEAPYSNFRPASLEMTESETPREKDLSKRRDFLREIEAKAQTLWAENGVFNAECCKPGEKFFGNFMCPYMNGSFHLGHASALSELEFAARFHRQRGANVLLPFAFNCTGIPIKTSADRLTREVQELGDPPVLSQAIQQQEAPEWKRLRRTGVSDRQISKLQNATNWLAVFPQYTMQQLKAFGLSCDWRRTLVTTDQNRYFDCFVRWQVRKLKSMGKIVKDVCYTIFSPRDGKPCADYERAPGGEGVGHQDYTIIKMEVVAKPFPTKLQVLEGRRVFLAAATLSPETMYAQTNAWVLPDGKYGAFEINETDVFILTHRAALNLAYQKRSKVPEKPTCLLELTGFDLIGLPLKSPLTLVASPVIYALPMLTVPTNKGTGILASVPSVDRDDSTGLNDLKSIPTLREKYGVKDKWVMTASENVIPIIIIPGFSQKATIRLPGLADKGTLLKGEFEGMRAGKARPLVKSKLIEAGDAIMYSEPEKCVFSRSGEECVVALTEEWFITYGDPEWKKLADECLSSMNLYSDEARRQFQQTLSRLDQRACSQSFGGLGTRIPWDEEHLVEWSTDSTIYMLYSTIAHLLHKGNMYGRSSSSSTPAIRPEQMTDEVWDFIFCDGSYPESSDISPSLLSKMKQEFEYWYPFDLRVCDKDQIQSHLIFCLYIHVAIMSKKHWPLGFRCNMEPVLNPQLMSNSRATATGYFMPLFRTIHKYSADATRFALAVYGNCLDNFTFSYLTSTARNAIRRLTAEISWNEKVLDADQYSSYRIGLPSSFVDKVFANEINIAVKTTEQHYQDFKFKQAIIAGFQNLQQAKEWYANSCGPLGMNRDLVLHFIDVQTRLIAPICPHYAEYVWRELLKKDGFVVNAGWPVADVPNLTLQRAKIYLEEVIKLMSHKLQDVKYSPDKKLALIGLIYVKECFDGWKAECLRILKEHFNSDTSTFSFSREFMDKLETLRSTCVDEDEEFIRFFTSKMSEAIKLGDEALDLKLPFGEIEVLQENLDLIKRRLGVGKVHALSASNGGDNFTKTVVKLRYSPSSILQKDSPSPGLPNAIFVTRGEGIYRSYKCTDEDTDFGYFLMYKEVAVVIGAEALDLKRPFREIGTLEENLDLVRRDSTCLDNRYAKVGSLVKLIKCPERPTVILLTRDMIGPYEEPVCC